MDPHTPHKLFATKYCFLIPGDDTSFFFFLSFFFGFLLFYVVISFYKFILLLLLLLLFFFFFFSWKLFFIFSCSRMFRNVPCSGFYRRPRHPHASGNFCIRIFSLAGYGFRPHISGEYGIRNRNFFNPPSNALQSGYLTIIPRGRVGYEMRDSQRGA